MLFKKRLYFQLGIIIFTFLLYLIALGDETAITLFIILLFCTSYIIANEQQLKLNGWLRIILYAVLAYYLYGFITTLPSSIRIIKLFQPDITNLRLINRIYFDNFWDLLIMGILAFVLIFNRKKESFDKKFINK